MRFILPFVSLYVYKRQGIYQSLILTAYNTFDDAVFEDGMLRYTELLGIADTEEYADYLQSLSGAGRERLNNALLGGGYGLSLIHIYYQKLKDSFTAEGFDAERIALCAKNAGCKYIVLTTRHHEGFSLYDTCGLSDFDAPHSPAGRDLVREFTDACRRHGLVPFFYHTTLDWYNKDFENDFGSYLEYLRKSVEILCTNYGKIGGLWFDGNWSKPDADWKESELYATIRKHQPEAIIVNNTGLHARGARGEQEIDVVTFEQGRPAPMNREGMSKMCIRDRYSCCV